MHLKSTSFRFSTLRALKHRLNSCTIVLFIFAPIWTYGNQSEHSHAYQQLISQTFPQLDTALHTVLQAPTDLSSTQELKKITSKTYRIWHQQFSEIKHKHALPNTRSLFDILPPNGFDLFLRTHTYNPPLHENYLEEYSDQELVIHYFLQIVGAVIKKNKSLGYLEQELIELFQCNNLDCELSADITEISDTPMSPSDEIKLKLFSECAQRTHDVYDEKRDEFCNAFLQQFFF